MLIIDFKHHGDRSSEIHFICGSGPHTILVLTIYCSTYTYTHISRHVGCQHIT